MASALWLFLVLIAFLLFYVHRSFYSYSNEFINLAKKIPGPRQLPFIGSGYLYIGATPNYIFHSLSSLSNKYNRICGQWIGPFFTVLLSNAQDIEVVLSAKTKTDRGPFYHIITKCFGYGLVTLEGEMWKRHRKLLNPLFNTSALPFYVSLFYSKAMELCDELECEVNNTDFDINPYLQKSGINIIFGTSFSENIQHELEEDKNKVLEYLKTIQTEHIHRICKPWLYYDFIYDNLPRGKYFKLCMEHARNIGKKAISRRQEDLKCNQSTLNGSKINGEVFLNYMLRLQVGKDQLTLEEVVDEMVTFVAAAFDTTTVAVGFLLLLLSRHSDVQDKLIEEIMEKFGSLEESNITYDDIIKLKYMDRVVKECLRLYPSIPYVMRRVLENVSLPSGYTIPKGTITWIMFYEMHRDADTFPNPEVFNPDNFLPENVASRNQNTYTPFGTGTRTCIGQKYAMLLIKTQLVCLLRRFVFTPTKYEPHLKVTITLNSSNGIRVGIKRRTISQECKFKKI